MVLAGALLVGAADTRAARNGKRLGGSFMVTVVPVRRIDHNLFLARCETRGHDRDPEPHEAMTRSGLTGAATALSTVAAVIFAIACIHELSYASGHPDAYGPAMVIAWAAGAGALVSVAVALLSVASGRTDP